MSVEARAQRARDAAGAIVRLPLIASTLTAPPARLIAPSVIVSLSSVPRALDDERAAELLADDGELRARDLDAQVRGGERRVGGQRDRAGRGRRSGR